MRSHPFRIFEPFASRLKIALFTKEDDIRSDQAAAEKFGLKDAAGLWQMHGKNVIRVSEPTSRTQQADGMATDQRELLLCIRAADCQNFVVYAPKQNVVGALHVGWRGIIAGTIPAFYELLEREWGIRGEETFVGAGPSLCVQCAEFTDPTREVSAIPSRFIHGRNVDLRAAADHQFQECGVPSDHLERSPDCTKCTARKYWTYRGGDRDAVKEGHTNMLCCALLSS